MTGTSNSGRMESSAPTGGHWQPLAGSPLIGKTPLETPSDTDAREPLMQVRQENLQARFVTLRDVDQAIGWLKATDFMPD
jgi:hypothetical protein